MAPLTTAIFSKQLNMSYTESYVTILHVYNNLTQPEPMVLYKIAVNCNNKFSGFFSKT